MSMAYIIFVIFSVLIAVYAVAFFGLMWAVWREMPPRKETRHE